MARQGRLRAGFQGGEAGFEGFQPGARAGEHFTLHLLYVLILAVPISGWLMSSAKGFQTVYLGIIPLPDLLTKDKALGDALLLEGAVDDRPDEDERRRSRIQDDRPDAGPE